MRMILDRLQRFDASGEYNATSPSRICLRNFAGPEPRDRLVVDDENGCGHAAWLEPESISWRSSAKSIGWSKATARARSPCDGFRIAIGVIMITGTSGRSARTFGSISSPLMPAC